ncbi:DinB family protein [Roseivirga sp. UBA1976]|uniref:DinB family protein n=1 Tax=Roseivirga sp. UBA1976 TaxID=1947386 RepID=UPI00257CDCE3|nr:DinB family protein [Roseivirga sp. UBA1976]|tara:strand:+ start:3180 stop:3710 length:531 start_codon:yes stop_codon:yes gene_type:complete
MHEAEKNIQTDWLINQLADNKEVFLSLLEKTPPHIFSWKPEPGRWNLLEIICHLADEEKHDFKYRIQVALDPNQFPFLPIDPEAWVTEKSYATQHFTQKLNEWAKEREQSVEWLRKLVPTDWEAHLVHPEYGQMTARNILANWVAHDYIHLRQIIQLKRACLQNITGESLAYAGRW